MSTNRKNGIKFYTIDIDLAISKSPTMDISRFDKYLRFLTQKDKKKIE